MSPPPRFTPTFVTAAWLLPLILTGCVNSKFATVSNVPMASMGLHGNRDPLNTTLDNVIVRHGAGSWKQEAFWDEYVLSLTNHHRAPVVVHSVRLVDTKDISFRGSGWCAMDAPCVDMLRLYPTRRHDGAKSFSPEAVALSLSRGAVLLRPDCIPNRPPGAARLRPYTLSRTHAEA